MIRTGHLALVALLSIACSPDREPDAESVPPGVATDTAVFGGGCFWCVEEAFDPVTGVISTTSGYSGGRVADPTYEQVSAGGTGHVEVVRVIYDPARIEYEDLLDVYWRNVDPLTPDAQFCDEGPQYRSVIFAQNGQQRRLADESRTALAESGRFTRPIVTETLPRAPFYPAEEYHQDYYRKNPVRYRFYKYTCGRAERLAEVWGD